MATPNYGFEKRQRELAKKKKKEEKLRAKADRKDNPQDATPDTPAANDELTADRNTEPPAPAA